MAESQIEISGLQVNYKDAGAGLSILILHGWGSSSDSWTEVQSILAEKGCRAVVPDLPGFGKTEPPLTAWGVEEYANFVLSFAQDLQLQTFTLLGHSFGGQIAIQFAVQHPEKLEKLVLVSAAGVRRTPGVAKKAVMFFAKLASFALYLVPFEDLRNNIRNSFYMIIRRRDYVRAQGIMKNVFQKVITQDLTAKLSHIKTPTFIVWGERDDFTPVQDAYLMKECIPQAELKIFPEAKHALNFEIPEKLSELTAQFIRS